MVGVCVVKARCLEKYWKMLKQRFNSTAELETRLLFQTVLASNTLLDNVSQYCDYFFSLTSSVMEYNLKFSNYFTVTLLL